MKVMAAQKPRRKSKRKHTAPTLYVPAEKIRYHHVTDPKKKARRYCAKQKTGPKPKKKKGSKSKQLAIAKFMGSEARHGKSLQEQEMESCEKIFIRGVVENTSEELLRLMKMAMEIQKDFSDDAKIEFPRFRCLQCLQYFPISTYRKVRLRTCHFLFFCAMHNASLLFHAVVVTAQF